MELVLFSSYVNWSLVMSNISGESSIRGLGLRASMDSFAHHLVEHFESVFLVSWLTALTD